MPDDQILQRGLLAYASDMLLLSTCMLPYGLSRLRDKVQEASLDHALWIPEGIKLDDWLLYIQDSPWPGSGRGFNRGLIYTHDGRLVASVAQEGLIRRGCSIVYRSGRGERPANLEPIPITTHCSWR